MKFIAHAFTSLLLCQTLLSAKAQSIEPVCESNWPLAKVILAQAAINLVAVEVLDANPTHATTTTASTLLADQDVIGIHFGSQSGISLNVSASKSRGNADGQDVVQSNTHITAGNTASITSGGDATLKGAVVTANTVRADVGGNLNIESLQDTSTYINNQTSGGGGVSLCISPLCYGTSSVSVSGGKSNIDSNYASVTEQSGIKAGDGGFQVSVKKDTDLKGGAITSTQAAIDNNKNSFDTGGQLTTSDIQNKADYKGEGYSINASLGFQAGDQSTAKTPEQVAASKAAPTNSGSVGIGSDNGSASSVTQAAISGIAGNKDARTGDAEAGIQKIFDANKVQREIDAQIAITAEFGKQATKAGAQFAQDQLNQANALTALAELETDPTRKADLQRQAEAIVSDWKEGGTLRMWMHAGIGLLGGGVDGALGAAASAAMTPSISDMLADANLPDVVRSGLLMAAGTAIGATFGGGAGATTGFNEVTNNGLGTVIKRLGVPAIIGCLRTDVCQRMTGAIGVAMAAQAAKIMADNPGMSESIAYTIAVTDLSNYGLGGKPATQPSLPSTTTTSGSPVQTHNNTGGNQIRDLGPDGNIAGGGYGAGISPPQQNLTYAVPPSITNGSGQLPPGIGGLGTPIAMPPTANPNQTAEDFAKNAFNGQTPISLQPVGGGWLAKLPDGTTVLYRPAGQATGTAPTTASVDVNGEGIKAINNGVPAKFKFPKV